MDSTALDRNTWLLLLIAVAMMTLPHASHLPAPLSTLFLLLWGWRLACLWKPGWLPHKLILHSVSICAMGLLISQQTGIIGREAGTAIFVTALGLKLLEIRSRRDVYRVVFLTFIVAATVFLYHQSMLMVLYIVTISIVLLATLVSVNSQQAKSFNALKSALSIILQALPLTIIIFLVFPRLQAPRWMLFDQQNQSWTGLSDSLEPGSISELGLSAELAFRAKFNGPVPPSSQRYWRGPVFSFTDGKRWSAGKEPEITGIDNKLQVEGTSYRYTLLMEPQQHKWVYALDMAADYPVSLYRNAYYQLLTQNDPAQRTEYSITSYPAYNTGDISAKERLNSLQLPATPSPRIKQLVRTLQGGDDSPDLFIAQLLNHFRNEPFHYTLKPPLMLENPIETFLFDSRYGFCSHYATAFVYLLRVANIPARVVSGYQGGKLNPVGGFIEVRQANAHAWAEAWLEQRGWVRFDPTAAVAPERIEHDVNIDLQIASGSIDFTPTDINASVPWLKQARQLWSSLDYQWHRWVIHYGNAGQSAFLAALGIESIKTMAMWLIASVALISVTLAWIILGRQNTVQTDPVLRQYHKFCRLLAAKNGPAIKTGEGALDYARRASQVWPQQADEIERITSLYLRLRYQPNPNPQDFINLRQSVARFTVDAHG